MYTSSLTISFCASILCPHLQTMSSLEGLDVANSPVYILCCVGVLANVMLLVAFINNPLKCFRNSAAYLLGNLAVCDSLYNLSFMVSISLNYVNKFVAFFLFISFYSSMVTMFSIALDRFLMITYIRSNIEF